MSRRTFEMLVGVVAVGMAVMAWRGMRTGEGMVVRTAEAKQRQPMAGSMAHRSVATTVPVAPVVERRRRLKDPKPIPLGVMPSAPVVAAVKPEPMVPLPVARVALDLVGEDPDAEEVWADAINDPLLSAHDRSDLIEDLNESGFPDPANVTEEDLPLIVNRLALIEDLAPDAMDETNADAFAEAYKDLLNMYVTVTAR